MNVRTPSPVRAKSYAFAKAIVSISRDIQMHEKEYVLTKQLMRSGTSIAANITEATQGQSKRDFISKMSISLKEACESKFWLQLLIDTNLGDSQKLTILKQDCTEIIKLLTAIIKTSKQNQN